MPDQAKTKTQLLAELNNLRRRVAELEAAERRPAETETAPGDNWYRLIFETTPQGIWQVDPQGTILAVNPGIARMLGCTPAGLVGRSLFDFIDEADLPQAETDFMRRKQGRPEQVEARLRRKDGSPLWVFLTTAPVMSDQGEFLFGIGMFTDITARKEAEVALGETEARLRAVLNNNSITVFDQDQELRYTRIFNPNQNFTAEGVLGKTDADLLPPAEAARLTEIKGRVLATGVGERQTVQTTFGGASFYYDLTVEPLSDPAGVSCVAIDITARKQAEEDLRASEARFKAVFDCAGVGMVLIDPNGSIMQSNPLLQQILGYSTAELNQSVNTSSITHPDDRALTKATMADLLSGRIASAHTEKRYVHKNGQTVWVDLSVTPIRAEKERPVAFIGAMVDITARKQAEEALRVSEQKVRQVIERSADAVILNDETGRMIEWNPAAEQITGLARDAVLGRPAWEIKFNMLPAERRTPELYARLEANAQAFLQSGQAPQAQRLVEVELQRPDGSYRDVEVVDFAVETGAGFGWGSILRDVTERKQAQRIEDAQLAVSRILAESPETAVALKQILEAMAGQLEWQSAHLWRLDHTGSRLIWQDGWCAPGIPELAAFDQASQSYTFERGEGLSGAAWQTGRAIWDQDLHLVKNAADARVAGLHSATAIPIVMDSAPVGIMTFFSRSARPLDERLLAVLTDLGRQIGQFMARKEAEAALRESRERLELVLEGAELGMWDWHIPSGQAVFNERWAEMLGYSLAEVERRVSAWENLVHPDDLARVSEALQAHLAGQTPLYQTEHRMRTKTGEWKWILDIGKVQEWDTQGQPVRARGIHQDITAAKLLEERLRQVQKMEAVGQLAAGMAHHYNNMLTTIIGYTSLALYRLPPNDPLTTHLKPVLATAEQAAALVRQLLAFARKQLLQPKTVNLNGLILKLQPELEQQLPTLVELLTYLAPDLGQVQVDPGQFEHLLRSLTTNAGEAMPRGGRLTLTTRNVSLGSVEAALYELPPGDYVLLTVKDTGRGLSDKVKAHLFEPFFTTKPVGQGTGLSLAMALGIAKQHSGHLLAESQPGQGTIFMLYLPRLAPPAAPADSTQSSLSPD